MDLHHKHLPASPLPLDLHTLDIMGDELDFILRCPVVNQPGLTLLLASGFGVW